MAYPKGNGNTNEWCLEGILNIEVLGTPLNSGIYLWNYKASHSHKVIIQTSGDMRTSNYAIWALYPVFLETNFQCFELTVPKIKAKSIYEFVSVINLTTVHLCNYFKLSFANDVAECKVYNLMWVNTMYMQA